MNAFPISVIFLVVAFVVVLEAKSSVVWDKSSANELDNKDDQAFERSSRISAYLKAFGGRSRLSPRLKGRPGKRFPDWGDNWYQSIITQMMHYAICMTFGFTTSECSPGLYIIVQIRLHLSCEQLLDTTRLIGSIAHSRDTLCLNHL
ncbi:hypothetical protein CAPTEDRAFT_192150 [Capitella teleta]|uniref:Uncharacterized protein n=1 Tax=Capitella teleta TaxID=283909 RepID=R7VH79_CAPTE|nr:hypothetical protein CAPTEDRAFT_192150 [Capitella teleta]|eukprot:ELU15055.1 hypothetical protein CAPTEDRAFT_192150 [Capitella teleta]